MDAILLSSRTALDGGFDPKSVIGKRVKLEILLEWELELPEGTIVRLVQTNAPILVPGNRNVYYLVELDSEVTFEPPGRGRVFHWGLPKEITTRHIIIEMRRVDKLLEELRGEVSSEWIAPILYSPRNEEVLTRSVIRFNEDTIDIGPARVRVFGL